MTEFIGYRRRLEIHVVLAVVSHKCSVSSTQPCSACLHHDVLQMCYSTLEAARQRLYCMVCMRKLSCHLLNVARLLFAFRYRSTANI